MGEIDRLAVIRHVLQAAAVVHIFVGVAAVCPLGTQTVGVVGVLPGDAVIDMLIACNEALSRLPLMRELSAKLTEGESNGQPRTPIPTTPPALCATSPDKGRLCPGGETPLLGF